MKRAAWYWHRLRAMGPAEIFVRVQRSLVPIPPCKVAPIMEVTDFPGSLPVTEPFHPREWKAFGRLPLRVDDPPRWNYDYLAGVEVSATGELNYRNLPNGADIKLIWELSRWYEIALMAQARQKDKCVEWLTDWVDKNPPFNGWNWTSALESGMRLIHFVWIDSLLGGLGILRDRIVPPHVCFTWHRRSVGSSANNHLLGELAGIIGAMARWPETQLMAPGLDRLHRLWEREVLAQFAEDGGNREQALNYHAYSLDLCQFARKALLAAGRQVSPAVEQRLAAAEQFFPIAQVPGETWDYGDSDDAMLFGGAPRKLPLPRENHWHYFAASGIARYRSGPWDLRWDLSPLGYLSTAAHGHLDALHLSIWWNGMAVIIDPGTGAYYADAQLRKALASWNAHNGPHLPEYEFPKRLGPFLWSAHHAVPTWQEGRGQFQIPEGKFSRQVTQVENGWQVEDSFAPHRPFIVRWQFAPGAEIASTGNLSWRLKRQEARFDIQVSGGTGDIGQATVSPGFRQMAQAPFLELKTGSEACVLRTIFLTC